MNIFKLHCSAQFCVSLAYALLVLRSSNILLCNIYSNSITGKKVNVTKEDGKLELENINELVTYTYESNWWLGCVLLANHDMEDVKVFSIFMDHLHFFFFAIY